MRLLRLFLLLLFFYGCNKEKLKAPDAFFIQPQNVSVTTSTMQGTSSHKITDLWYYVNNQFKGAFPSGNILPVASSGETEIVVFAGIKNNGISATRQPYEFYEAIHLDTSVSNGSTIHQNFTFSYKPSVKFHWIEDFEGWGTTSGVSIKTAINSDTIFTILNKISNPAADVFEGTKCFYFGLDDTRRLAHFESVGTYTLPKGGAPVYLEVNYKCSQPFSVGLYSGLNTYPISVINTSYSWNKIYIQLSSGATQNTGTTAGLYIAATKSTDDAWFYIDNIKILSY